MPHGHGLAVGAYFLAWLIIVRFTVDVVHAGFPNTFTDTLHAAV